MALVVNAGNLVPDGGTLFRGNYTTTALIGTKVLDNSRVKREKATFYCSSSQNGTWILYDVDEANNLSQIVSIAVTGGTLNIYTYNHIAYRIYATFTPGAAPGTETLVIRGYLAGGGLNAA